jgi:hypothetical protein
MTKRARRVASLLKPMRGVTKISPPLARRPEKHGVSRRLAGEGMGGSVGLTKVGFEFGDAAHPRFPGSGYQQLSQQLAGYNVGGFEKEVPGEDRPGGQRSSHGLL